VKRIKRWKRSTDQLPSGNFRRGAHCNKVKETTIKHGNDFRSTLADPSLLQLAPSVPLMPTTSSSGEFRDGFRTAKIGEPTGRLVTGLDEIGRFRASSVRCYGYFGGGPHSDSGKRSVRKLEQSFGHAGRQGVGYSRTGR
jgi:hypothetical protein